MKAETREALATAMLYALLSLIVLLAVIFLTIWVQANFGKITAAYTLGGLIMISVLAGGIVLGARVHRTALTSMAGIMNANKGAHDEAIAHYNVMREQLKHDVKAMMLAAQTTKQIADARAAMQAAQPAQMLGAQTDGHFADDFAYEVSDADISYIE